MGENFSHITARRIVMKTVCALLLAALCFATGGNNLSSAAETYTVDPSHTSLIFSISHLGYSYTYGRFNELAGRYLLDREAPQNSQFQFQVNVASVDTNDPKRDEHLRSADFFNAKQFPTISFQSSSVSKSENGFDVTGNLTLHGVTKEVKLPMQLMGEGKGPYSNYRTGFLFQLQIKRSDYGITGMQGPIGDNVAITVSFEGIREQ
jgi:polyisoprenoid-binding protein YceI